MGVYNLQRIAIRLIVWLSDRGFKSTYEHTVGDAHQNEYADGRALVNSYADLYPDKDTHADDHSTASHRRFEEYIDASTTDSNPDPNDHTRCRAFDNANVRLDSHTHTDASTKSHAHTSGGIVELSIHNRAGCVRSSRWSARFKPE